MGTESPPHNTPDDVEYPLVGDGIEVGEIITEKSNGGDGSPQSSAKGEPSADLGSTEDSQNSENHEIRIASESSFSMSKPNPV
eukprot:TRINITY_DN15867_c0_g1_i1.p2 TRINITY_DN15867_c0_g1~~TRINITY_DN15867_c0_g1_i1.p2  ORF type:complete len:83 (-),score=15.63 TRINITY_DN15867_c0_g1_i1:13-261(-)